MHYVRAATAQLGLRVQIRSAGKMRLTKHFNPKQILAIASEYTGVVYKQRDYQKAHDDLEALLAPMRVAAKRECDPFDRVPSV